MEKFVALGTVCAYPKFTPVPFHEEDLWNGYPEETNAPYGLAKKMMLVQSQSYRQQYGFNSIFLLPVNLYGPRDNFNLETSHVIPALIRKCVEAKKRGQGGGRGVGRRLPNARVPVSSRTPPKASCWRPNATMDLSRSTWDRDSEISIRDLAELIATPDGLQRPASSGTPANPTASRAGRWIPRRREALFGFRAQTTFEEGLRRTIDWYLANRERFAESRSEP